MSRVDFEKKYAAELTNAKDTLAAIQQTLDRADKAPLDAPCELKGATMTQVSPPTQAGNLEVLSEGQLLTVLDPARAKKLMADKHGQFKSPTRIGAGPLQRLADPKEANLATANEWHIKAAELSRGVTHVLVSRGGEDEDAQFFLFDVKQRSLVCSFSLTVEVPADLADKNIVIQTKKDGVTVRETTGTDHARENYFSNNLRVRIGAELERRFKSQ